MTRPLRTTVALAVITAAAAAFILTVEREDDTRRAALTSARAAFHFNPARVSAIRIRTPNATLPSGLRHFLIHSIQPALTASRSRRFALSTCKMQAVALSGFIWGPDVVRETRNRK